MTSVKTRFAPSPTGLMHLGNARTAVLSALAGERFLLRIEDTDLERSRREFVAALMEDLEWLGLVWDEGPSSSEPEGNFFQSRRVEVYRQYYEELEQSGRAYYCFCSPQELEISRKVQLSSGRPPRYSGKCSRLSTSDVTRRLQEGVQPTLRFRVPRGEVIEFDDQVRGPQRFASDDIGDFIIRRADDTPAFFFCNAVDDALMGVNLVLRGEDHLTNTPRQLMILQALALPRPDYAHISLIVGDDGAPLSKRNGSRSISQMRQEGYLPAAILNMLARLGHHYDSEELLPLPSLKSGFDVRRLGKSPARFDPIHLDHWQQLAVRSADDAALWSWLPPDLRIVVPVEHHDEYLDIVRSNCVFPEQAEQWARVLFADELHREPEVAQLAEQAGEGFFLSALDAAQTAPRDYKAFLEALKRLSGAKGKQLFMPLRAALTGRTDGPELARIYELLDPARARRRLAEFTYVSE
ncbi:glutamate--tRNA ligase [Methylolobus aquaticus]